MNHLNTFQEECQKTLDGLMSEIYQAWAPPSKMTITEWSNKYRYLAPESSAIPGKYSVKLTPWVPGMHEAIDDPFNWKIVAMKSAQAAWTDGVLNNYLGRKIDIDPSAIVGMFAKADAAKEYVDEKFEPMVTATPRLKNIIDVTTSRKDGNRKTFKRFPGGFLKLVGSNSISNVKSTPAPVVFVEEPDDAADNVGSQGDAIKLLEERTKTFPKRKVIFGGTPSIKGVSTIEAAFLESDQRKFFVPCHDCHESHVLDWDNVTWQTDQDQHHEIYGDALPDTAAYACPHCGSLWTDFQKNKNVRKGEWIATTESRGIAGFYINEIYSPFPGSKLVRLVERYLQALKKQDSGDNEDMIVFVNSCKGLPYEIESNAPELDELEERAEDYEELTVPAGGLVLVAGVDVQHDRLAVQIWAYGRGEEQWLVYWGELPAKKNTLDITDPVWSELDKLLFRTFKHEKNYQLRIAAVSIDSSDGQTSDAVYSWVRPRQKRGVMAVKGSSNDYGTREIFSKPKAIDTRGKSNTKASKYGLQIYIVGTHKAKDLLIGDKGRISLTGSGAGRMHWYKTVRADFYEQTFLAEVKAPHKKVRKKLIWQLRSGVRNEGTDCCVMSLHASRSLRLNLMTDKQWDDLEAKFKQIDLFAEEPVVEDKPVKENPVKTKRSSRAKSRRRNGGYINAHRK